MNQYLIKESAKLHSRNLLEFIKTILVRKNIRATENHLLNTAK